MELTDIDSTTWRQLDNACGGVLGSLEAYCIANGCQASLTVQTHLEGLEKGQMKLFLQIVKDGETADYAVARMEGSAQIIGWNLYLHDIMESARNHLDRAVSKVDTMETN